MRKTKALTQCYALQEVVYQKIIELKNESAAECGQIMAQLSRAWDVLEERKRILRGRPLPGSLRPIGSRTKRGRVVPLLLAADEPANPVVSEEPDCQGGLTTNGG